jgi:hypothetical protein
VYPSANRNLSHDSLGKDLHGQAQALGCYRFDHTHDYCEYQLDIIAGFSVPSVEKWHPSHRD